MTRVRVDCFTVSADGFGAGTEQSADDPMGRGGMALHGWALATRTLRTMFGQDGGSDGIDDGFAARGMDKLGAWVLGRNMFGPIRGEWPDESWRGWWGERPPYGCDVFVLTHHPRADLSMDGGTRFRFVADGLAAALDAARAAAGGRDVRIGGGVATLREAFRTGAVDAAHVAVAPVFLGRGESLWEGLDLPALGYRVARSTPGEGALHVEVERA